MKTLSLDEMKSIRGGDACGFAGDCLGGITAVGMAAAGGIAGAAVGVIVGQAIAYGFTYACRWEFARRVSN